MVARRIVPSRIREEGTQRRHLYCELADHAICFIGDQGFYQDFAQYVIAKRPTRTSAVLMPDDVDIVY